MKKSTKIIHGTSSINKPNFNFKNNADISKAFDLLYLQASPVPKPFIGYHSLQNVVSKNLQININDILKNPTASQVYNCNLHPNQEAVTPSLQKDEQVFSSKNESTISIIRSIKQRHRNQKKREENQTLLNTFSVMKEKKKRSSITAAVNDSVTVHTAISSDGVLKNKKPDKFSKKNTTPDCIKDDGDKSVKIVLSRCDNKLNEEVNTLLDKKIFKTKTKSGKPNISQLKDHENIQIKVKDETTVLKDWIIKPVPGCRGVCVEGQKVDMTDFWHSSAIAEVRKPKVVVTISGSVYKLRGKINKLCTIDNGFPKDIADAFAHGFPKNWLELIQNFFTSIDKSISFHKEETAVKVKKFGGQRKTSPIADNKSNNKDTLKKNTTVITQHGLIQQEINLSDMVVTRSGRVSLPPLARWSGQHYIKDPDSKTIKIGFTTKTAEKFLSHETKQLLQMPKRIQKEVYHKSLSNSLNSPTFLNSESKENFNKTYPNNKKLDMNLKRNSLENVLIKRERNKKSERSVIEKDKKLSIKNKKGKSPLQQKEQISLSISNSFSSQDNDYAPPEKGNGKQNKKLTTRGKKGQSLLQQREPNSVRILNSLPSVGNDYRFQEIDIKKHILSEENKKYSLRGKKYKSPLQQKEVNSLSVSNSFSSKDNDSFSPETDKRKQTIKSRKRRRTDSSHIEGTPRNKKRRVRNSYTVLDDWSDSEQNKFHRALHTIDSNDTNYWFKVSQFVGSKSEIQCQEFHSKYLETVAKSKHASSKPRKEKPKNVRKKGEPIRGGKGTLKRKKDLRAFLDEQNEDYEDDLFNSSPLVKKIPKSILNCDFDKNVSDIFGLNHNFFTPVAGRSILGTPSTNIRAVLASVRKGPSGLDSIMEETPISTKRQKADVLIKKFNGRQKKSIPVYEKKESSIDIELSTLPVKSLFTPVTQPSISVDENDEDDGKHLYYWDDDE